MSTQATWRHSGAGNSRGKGPAYNHNGILSNWDIHQLDQQHLFEYRWDTSVNHTQERLTQHYQYDANGYPTGVDLGNGATESYQHDALGRMTQQVTEYGAQYDFAYDARDRRVHTELSNWERPYAFHSLYDQRQELGQWDESLQPYRSLNTLPQEEQGLSYGTLISQQVHQWQNEEFRVSGFAKNYAAKAYFHQDHLGSTTKISGEDPNNAFRWDYTPMGEAYGFKHRYSHEQMTRTHVGHSPKRHLVPYLYTGKYETNLSGLVQMDARWYQPKLGRWLQPDYYNFAQLSLPKGARQQLLASTGLNTQGLLKDPGQQMRYGYVSGNPLRWTDPLGLCYPEMHGVEPISESGGYATYAYRDGSYYQVQVANPNSALQEGGPKGLEAVSVGAGFTPAGTVLDVYTAVTGKDAITGEEVSPLWRVAGIVPFVSELRKGAKLADEVTEKASDITTPYKRPSGATTKAQRESVQDKPCVDCGATTSKQVADHKTPLVEEYYETGTIDKTKMRSLDAVQPQCPTCSARQGAEMSRYSRQQKKDLGL